tara:strand:- start:1311 stop:2465 length:1155 start_codon:yes stop_codon:yes gene_type:complete
MDAEYLTNPLNRRKKKYKYYLRKLENIIKKFLIYLFLLPLSLPSFLINCYAKHKFYFKDFFNQNAVVFIVFILKEKKNSKFLINLTDFHKAISRFGFFFILKNFSLKINTNKVETISFLDKRSDYYFNQDYFYYFDKKLKETDNNLVIPFYLPKNYYLKNTYKKYRKLINSEKKFKIIFSGTAHDEWYGSLDFINNNNEKFLNRQSILNITKEHYSNRIIVINEQSELEKIESTKKDILILETNPEKSLRKKNFLEQQHLDLISQSNFFLCMPGTSMPLCYHLIETCLVGTVPILSYNNYLSPQFSNDEAMTFFSKDDLLSTINKALEIDLDNYSIMQKKIINYYDKNFSPEGVYKKLLNKEYPLEIFINLDHESTKKREKRLS